MTKIFQDRKYNRLPEYDYTSPAYYFITICVKDKQSCFGKVINEEVVLNKFGRIVKSEWKRLSNKYQLIRKDNFVIMPNHFHGILIIDDVDDLIKEITKGLGTTGVGTTGVGTTGVGTTEVGTTGVGTTEVGTTGVGTTGVGTTHELSLQQREQIKLLKIQAKKSLSTYIGEFKMLSSKKIHESGLKQFKWQRSFYDRIIRNEFELSSIRYYIDINPLKWEIEKSTPENLEL